MARLTGRPDEADGFEARREALNRTIHARFYDPATQTYATGSQLDMVYPMLVGATPDFAPRRRARKALPPDARGDARPHRRRTGRRAAHHALGHRGALPGVHLPDAQTARLSGLSAHDRPRRDHDVGILERRAQPACTTATTASARGSTRPSAGCARTPRTPATSTCGSTRRFPRASPGAGSPRRRPTDGSRSAGGSTRGTLPHRRRAAPGRHRRGRRARRNARAAPQRPPGRPRTAATGAGERPPPPDIRPSTRPPGRKPRLRTARRYDPPTEKRTLKNRFRL